ncbi:MAG: DNA polymerase III subunit gamma/tau, partial [Patescibacteria group bacterium]|nr:DNA polymerase III subunit gamma/tau [Patescibacteria group bacterium]
AYVFSGPRGVGKTTAARVFSKALNCENLKEGEPCNACGPCLAAQEGRLVDFIEMDAATHTGVDAVRESIVEHVRFAPMMGKRKIYVLDEAHMLSTSSWNALLKTLEEPPPYAFFIFATTEWHKVPATIVSRCQRFDFKRIADEPLAMRIKKLAADEGWKIDDEVVHLIVSRSEGCVRDAETLLGQIGSLGETSVTMDVAGLVIPPSRIPLAAHLMELWAARDHDAALTEAQRLVEDGIPVLPLFDDLIFVIKKLLSVSGNAKRADEWKQGTEDDRAIAKLVQAFDPGELNDLALLLFERRRDIKSGVDPLFALQLAGTVVACGLLKHSTEQTG